MRRLVFAIIIVYRLNASVPHESRLFAGIDKDKMTQGEILPEQSIKSVGMCLYGSGHLWEVDVSSDGVIRFLSSGNENIKVLDVFNVSDYDILKKFIRESGLLNGPSEYKKRLLGSYEKSVVLTGDDFVKIIVIQSGVEIIPVEVCEIILSKMLGDALIVSGP